MMMMRFNWILSRTIERLGLAGLMALSALLALLCMVFFALLPAKQSLSAMETINISNQANPSRLSPEEALNAFVARFPNNAQRVAGIRTIVDTAAAMGLGLDNIAYKTKMIQGDRLNHYHVDFNLVGNYADVRQYLASVMADMPTASLDSLSMDRQDTEQNYIQARVRLTLHFAS